MAKDIKSKKYPGVYHRILEDKSKTYYILYKDPITHKKQRIKIGSSKEGINETYCNNKRNEILSKLRLGDDPNIPILKAKTQKNTLNDISLLFFASKEGKSSPKNIRDRKSRYNKSYSNSIGDIPLQMITKNYVVEFQKKLIKKDYAPSNVNYIMGLGKSIFKYAIDEEIYKGINPFSKVKALKGEKKRLRYLNKEEIQELKKSVIDDNILNLFVLISTSTGGRLETIMNIQKKDINFNTNSISLYDYKNQSQYEGALTEDVKNFIQEHFNTLKANDYLISYDNGSKSDKRKIQRRLQPILNKLFNNGLDLKDTENRVVVHTLRHTFASILAIEGTPIFTIQKLMNHKDIKQTMRYAKLSPESGINAVLKVFDSQ